MDVTRKTEGWHGWDAYAPYYDWENAQTVGRRDIEFWRLMAQQADGPVLELGCGTGRVALPVAKDGATVVGIDRSAGRVVYQDLTRIDLAIEDGSFAKNAVLVEACARAHPVRGGSGRLHLLGLVSDGGVHSSFEHLKALVDLAARQGVPQVFVHAFTDGRDTPPKSGEEFVRTLGGHLDAVSAREDMKRELSALTQKAFETAAKHLLLLRQVAGRILKLAPLDPFPRARRHEECVRINSQDRLPQPLHRREFQRLRNVQQ